jgi:hypothetical protein
VTSPECTAMTQKPNPSRHSGSIPRHQVQRRSSKCAAMSKRCWLLSLTPVVWYTTSTHHRVKQSPKSTAGMSSVAYMMLCSARDQSCGQQAIGTSIATILKHIPHTLFRLFGKKPYACDMPSSLLFWYGSLWFLAVPQT